MPENALKRMPYLIHNCLENNAWCARARTHAHNVHVARLQAGNAHCWKAPWEVSLPAAREVWRWGWVPLRGPAGQAAHQRHGDGHWGRQGGVTAVGDGLRGRRGVHGGSHAERVRMPRGPSVVDRWEGQQAVGGCVGGGGLWAMGTATFDEFGIGREGISVWSVRI